MLRVTYKEIYFRLNAYGCVDVYKPMKNDANKISNKLKRYLLKSKYLFKVLPK
ncbi:hypothetical protein Ctaglu_40120 [Clostridium tagluense]|uniref:Uncharacterized protein n=1 Tax=Clostridium tagluense TaxID=360422 RepID=A0A401US54_9CLOT|nr:hypothetical protein Ctaglu_40120 [Clostridium tagluense]